MLRQVGAIPYVFRNGEPLVLMVTSRTHERWIFPKGAAENKETAAEAAAREAYEEAGIRGTVVEGLSEDVRAIKIKDDEPTDLLVTYVPLAFDEQLDDWPERKRRDRNWVRLSDARKIAGGEDIRTALKAFERFVPTLYKYDSKK